MSEDERRREMAARKIVLEVPGMDAVRVSQVPYGSGEHTMDVYRPATGDRHPAMIVAFGFGHPMFAAGLRQMGVYTSWARLLAASGVAVVTYGYADPVADVDRVVAHVREHATALGIDATRLGVFAASGNVPRALALLTADPTFRCAALLYGYMFEGTEPAKQMLGIATAEGKSAADLPATLPLMIVRAGQDATPGLNASVDHFVAAALARNLPLTLINHATGVHAFDMMENTDASRDAIRAVVEFIRAST